MMLLKLLILISFGFMGVYPESSRGIPPFYLETILFELRLESIPMTCDPPNFVVPMAGLEVLC